MELDKLFRENVVQLRLGQTKETEGAENKPFVNRKTMSNVKETQHKNTPRN